MQMSKNETLILASASPRRQYLLEQAGLSFRIVPSAIDESVFPVTDPESYVKTLAEAKARDISEQYPDQWILGADTVVLIDGKLLGKPESRGHARQMLQKLSGQVHQVLTGFSLTHRKRDKSFTHAIKTDVVFKALSREEIEWYIRTREPFDKAGAYAIQGLGTFLVREIRGSYTNVVGLPVCEVIELLIREGVVRIPAISSEGEAE